MADDDSILEYLLQEENLPIVMEAAEYLERLKRDIHPVFWEHFNRQMEFRLAHSDLSERWKYIPHPSSSPRKPWAKTYLRTKSADKARPYLQFVFGQGSSENQFRLFWGVSRERPMIGDFILPDTTVLAAALDRRNLQVVEPGWVRWGYHRHAVHEANFLRRMYFEAESFVTQIMMGVWEFFADIEPLLTPINRELADA